MTTTRYDRMSAAADELKLQAMKAPGASVERATCLTLHDQLRADADELESIEGHLRTLRASTWGDAGQYVTNIADRIRGEK